MFWGRVAFVPGKAVFRVLGVEIIHDGVSSDLCHNAGGGDQEAFGIAFDDGGGRAGEAAYGKAVNKRMRRNATEKRRNRVGHRDMGGSEDVDSINFGRVCHADANFDARGRGEDFEETFSVSLAQLLTIRESRKFVGIQGFCQFLRNANGSRYDGTRKRSTARFVDARKARSAILSPELVFES